MSVRNYLFIGAALVILGACQNKIRQVVPRVDNPITITSPTPEATLVKVNLNDAQRAFTHVGNAFALQCLKNLYIQQPGGLVFSPLSLQYVLALVANGTAGITTSEIMAALGWEGDLNSLNAYYNLLLNELPALDESVQIKLSDAIIVQEDFPVKASFQKLSESIFYAPVERINMLQPELTLARVNEWAYRNTNGIIYPFLRENDIPENVLVIILNALYFKAKWSPDGQTPMFKSDLILHSQPFYCEDGTIGNVDYLVSSRHFRYGRLGNSGVVELPYSDGKYAMYIILPDEGESGGVNQLVSALSSESMASAFQSMTEDALVNLRLPKFEQSSELELSSLLKVQGITRVFAPGGADFSNFVSDSGTELYLSSVLQKSRIAVSEWGTEAGSVTSAEIASVEGSNQPQEIDFFANRPFVYCVVEKSTGIILFEGIFAHP